MFNIDRCYRFWSVNVYNYFYLYYFYRIHIHIILRVSFECAGNFQKMSWVHKLKLIALCVQITYSKFLVNGISRNPVTHFIEDTHDLFVTFPNVYSWLCLYACMYTYIIHVYMGMRVHGYKVIFKNKAVIQYALKININVIEILLLCTSISSESMAPWSNRRHIYTHSAIHWLII